MDFKSNPFTAEAYALLVAVQFYKDSSLNHLILEGAAIHDVNLLAKGDADWSQGGYLLLDVRNILNSYAVWFVMHVNRGQIMWLIGLPKMCY